MADIVWVAVFMESIRVRDCVQSVTVWKFVEAALQPAADR